MKFQHIIIGVSCLIACAAAQAQNTHYPQRTISLTVPYGAGGSTDGIARKFATLLGRELGQTVLIQNQPGGAGTLQLRNLASAEPDGYTLGFYSYSTSTFTSQILEVPYKKDDFELLGGIAEFSYGIVVAADSPINTVHDLVSQSKTSKGVFYGVTGAPNNFPFLQLRKTTGGQFDQVTYKSSAESINALIGGYVNVALHSASEFAQLVRSGKLKVIASAMNDRLPWFPETPTLREQGFDFDIRGVIGIAAPTGIPADVKTRLEAAVHKVVTGSEYEDYLVNTYGIKTYPASAADFSAYIDKGFLRMRNMIETYDIKGL